MRHYIIKIRIPEYLTHDFIKDVMSCYRMAEQGINIELIMRMSRDLIDMANEESLHMAIAAIPPEFFGGELPGSRELLWVAAPGFELDANSTIPLALQSSRCVYRELILSLLEASGTDYRIAFSAQGSMSVQAAVASGMGLTVIAEGMAPPELVQIPND